ncbi:MAG: GAF domain-containing sensor histidine kinase, partial [Candidatus Rokubacteria bacterium]|nr:GAF domain-containing sensor histidine kinase [Candidatus Rokubacteria bacterium]
MTEPGPPADRLAIFDEVARSVTSSLDIEVILPRIADAARRLCGSDTASIFLREGGADLMVPRFRVGEFPPAYEGLRIGPGQGLGGQAWRRRRPVRTANYEQDTAVPDHFRAVARQSGVRAVMAVPIQIGTEVQGLLYVGNRLARPFTDEDERACVWLANQAAVALQNAALFERERRLRMEAEHLAGLASYLTSSLDLPRVLAAIAEAVRDITGADLVRLALRDETDGTMRCRHRLGARAGGSEDPVLAPGPGLVGRALATGRPQRATDGDPALHADRGGEAFVEAEGVRTAMVVPIRSGDEIAGLIEAARRRPRPFSDEDERFVARLAEYAAVAIGNAQLHAEADRRRREAEILSEIVRQISTSLELDTVLQRIVEGARELCTADAAWITRPVGGGPAHAFRYMSGVRSQDWRSVHIEAGRGMGGLVLATGRSAFVPHVSDEHLRAAATSEPQLALLRELRIGSWIIVPLAVRGRVLGALTLVMAESGRRYTVADLAMAEDLGRRAAVAVENAQLYREARLASQAKDQFLAMLSHELRTPINAVYGWARILRDDRVDAETRRRALEVIERNARAQVQLIDDLLDVSRIVTGNLRLDVQPVDLAAVIEAAIDTVRPAAEARGVRLITVLDPRAAPIMGDPDRLQQVVWNLLSNSVKFTPRGGRVEITLRRVNSHVELVVADTGAGIDPALLPHLFERFRQGERSAGGLGLGLAIVRHLVEL